ncbi:MAG: phospholipase D-like domain-containing protein [Kofleriaceae bacterium]
MRCLVLCVALITFGCRAADDLAAPTIDAAPDGVDGTGCTATTPRTVPLEAFIGPTGLQARLGGYIDSATTSLDVQMYLFSVTELASHITAARMRGVAVRVILDPGEAANNAVYPLFNSGGVPWKNAASVYSYAHAKYLIIDRTTTVIMSMNFNGDAMVRERNYGVVDRDPEDVTDLQAIFDEDWALANGNKNAPAANLTCTRLIVSPINSNQRVLELIASAQTTLDVEVMYITDVVVQNYVAAAHDRGVTVRVILSDPSGTPGNTGMATFLGGKGIPVKYAIDQFYLHAKLIIADGVAFVGSENMSPTSFTQNREVGALALEPDQVALIQAQFDSDWAITTPAM